MTISIKTCACEADVDVEALLQAWLHTYGLKKLPRSRVQEDYWDTVRLFFGLGPGIKSHLELAHVPSTVREHVGGKTG